MVISEHQQRFRRPEATSSRARIVVRMVMVFGVVVLLLRTRHPHHHHVFRGGIPVGSTCDCHPLSFHLAQDRVAMDPEDVGAVNSLSVTVEVERETWPADQSCGNCPSVAGR